jgi:hypothetical protein
MTIMRGKVVVENGKFLASKSEGRYIKRSVSDEIRNGPAL